MEQEEQEYLEADKNYKASLKVESQGSTLVFKRHDKLMALTKAYQTAGVLPPEWTTPWMSETFYGTETAMVGDTQHPVGYQVVLRMRTTMLMRVWADQCERVKTDDYYKGSETLAKMVVEAKVMAGLLTRD